MRWLFSDRKCRLWRAPVLKGDADPRWSVSYLEKLLSSPATEGAGTMTVTTLKFCVPENKRLIVSFKFEPCLFWNNFAFKT